MVLLGIFLALLVIHLLIEFGKWNAIGMYRIPLEQEVNRGFSIVVCARNEGDNLPVLMHQLLEQDYPDYEVILILDHCTDESMRIASSIADSRFRFIEITSTPEGFNPKKYAIQQGISQASKEWILLTDGDCQVHSKKWISAYNDQITAEIEVVLGIGLYQKHSGLLSEFIQYETFQTASSYLSKAISGKPYMGVGRNLAYKKSIFLQSQGFKGLESITGGDDDLLIQKIATVHNTRVTLSKESQTLSAPSRSWINYLHQKTRHLSVGRYYKKEISFMLALRSVVHFFLWLCFLILVGISQKWALALMAFGGFLILKGLIYHRISQQLSVKFNMLLLPFLDFGYAVVLPLVGIRSFFVKNYVWKK